MNNLKNDWMKISTIPKVINGWFIKKNKKFNGQIMVSKVQNNQDQKTKVYSTSIYYPTNPNKIFATDYFNNVLPNYSKTKTAVYPSPSGKYTAIVTPDTENKSNKLEIIDSNSLIFSTANNNVSVKHGSIRISDTYGGIVWSPNENIVVYVAEKYVEPEEGFFSKKGKKKNKNKNSFNSPYEYKSSWGEGLSDTYESQLFMLNLANFKLFNITGIPQGILIGQPVVGPDNETILFVGYENSNNLRKLGIYAYNTRPSTIYSTKLIKGKNVKFEECKVLIKNKKCVFGPRFSNDGKKISFFSVDKERIHLSGCELNIYNLDSKKITKIVGMVDKAIKKDDFPGLYFFGMPRNIWSDDDKYIYLNSFWRSLSAIIIINIENKTISKIQNQIPKFGLASIQLLDIYQDILLCKVTSPVNPPSIYLYDTVRNKWASVTSNYKNHKLQAKWEIIQIYPLNCKDETKTFEAVVVSPNKIINPPDVLYIHGGPHSVYNCSFNYGNSAYLTKLGYRIIFVNYRGSIGFGQQLLKSNIATGNDVIDCMEAVKKTRKTNNIAVTGGSHGGLIACKLIAKYPEYFKCAIVCNPVTNIPCLSSTTDIPDWSYIETGLNWNDKYLPTSKAYTEMFNYSPISKISSIKTPVLMALGKKDMRVPYLPNIEFMNILYQRKVDTKLLLYDEADHSIDNTVEMTVDLNINIGLWLSKYCKCVEYK